ncbi:MAG: hypothetical protein EOO28_10995 [Comamonadaceae bacterium]|nr:MAG: hypothetical protein EOO28_10995 [Comamonadaceae bacterium]
MPAAATPDPTRCPLCGASNVCAMEMEKATGMKQPPCWCTRASFCDELLARVPPDALNQACICAACAAAMTPA